MTTSVRHALVLATSADLAFAAGTCLLSFLAHNPEYRGDILVLHDGLTPEALAALRAISPLIQPRELSQNHLLARLCPTPAEQALTQERTHPYTLAKFEIFDWLTDYDHLVWLDSDTLIRSDLSHLWHTPRALAWRPLPEGAFGRRAKALAALQPHSTVPLPNAGVLCFNAAPLRAAQITAPTLYALAQEVLARTSLRTLDEIALWLLASRHSLGVTELSLTDNHPVAQDGSDQANVLHAIGPDKFWTATPLVHACPDWQAYHRNWVALGGPPAPEAKLYAKVHPLSPAQALTQARNRTYWERLWPDLAPLLPPELWPELRTERGFLRLRLRGAPDALHFDLSRSASDTRFHLSVGLERKRIDDSNLTPRLHSRLAPFDLSYHEGRRIFAWGRTAALEDMLITLHALTLSLREEFPT